MATLIDTGFLLAYFLARDSRHTVAREALKRAPSDELIVPADVLHELFHMVATRLSYPRAIDFH